MNTPSYGICHLSNIPLRSKPANRSELVSQLLFGETFEIIEEREDWSRIQCQWDKCKGWIPNNQLQEISEKNLSKIQQEKAYCLEISQAAMGNNHYIPLLMGSTLPNYDGINFRFNGKRYTYSGQAIQPSQIQPSSALAIRIARKYLYAPYLWGGRSPFGIDASGFSQMVYKMMNIKMPRSAAKQAQRGKIVHFANEAQAGDLAFFENERGKTIHVGIILPEMEIIHAAGCVRIDRIDHYGIFNIETNRYTHKLRVIKRIL